MGRRHKHLRIEDSSRQVHALPQIHCPRPQAGGRQRQGPSPMTKFLDQAIDAVRRLSPGEQDEIARTIRLQTLESKGFKPVPGGFVFRVPNPWVFGRAKHYLVTVAQLEEVEAIPGPILSDIPLAVLASAIVSVVLFSARA